MFNRDDLLIHWLAVLFAILPILSCSAFQNQRPVIKDIIYAREVPVSFETLLICTTDDCGNIPLRFKWFSDNGTIKGHYGHGESITWVAPAVPGTYNVGVKVTYANGMETTGSVNIKVVAFSRKFIDISPDISLHFPLRCNDLITEQESVNPSTTAAIGCDAPLSAINKYTYTWLCNNNKIMNISVNDMNTSKIDWVVPGIPGYYTIMVTISDDWGNLYAGSVYFNVVNTGCCGGNGTCGVQ
ncbi:MAG: hypothetical protein WB588_02460 [Dehalococcoidia bacterium]